MKKLPFYLIAPALIYAFSCKSKSENKSEDTTQKTESAANLQSSADNSQAETNRSNARWEERKAKGDTLAMSYKQLQSWLPEITGYKKEGGPRGSQMNNPGMGSWSQAEQDYVNGENRVSVKIFDYNAAQQAFTGMTTMLGVGFMFEDDSKKQSQVDLGIPGVTAYETIYKTDKKAEMVLIVADRFIVNLESNGVNDEAFLRSVAKTMNLKEMASS